MGNFLTWLLNEVTFMTDYIDPETITFHERKDITFIYTTENKLYYEVKNTHKQIIKNNPILSLKYEKQFPGEDSDKIRESAEKLDLFGRIGNCKIHNKIFGKLVSFWNKEEPIYALLDSCLASLKEKGLIDDQCYVSTPFHNTVMIKDLHKVEMVQPDLAKIELQKAVHNATSEDKAKLLKLLGLGVGGRRSQYRDKVRELGIPDFHTSEERLTGGSNDSQLPTPI